VKINAVAETARERPQDRTSPWSITSQTLLQRMANMT